MTQSRFDLAFPDGHPGGQVLVIGARAGDRLHPLDPARTRIVQGHFPDYQALSHAGWQVAPDLAGSHRPADAKVAADAKGPEGAEGESRKYGSVIVFLPRSKTAARAAIAQASACLDPGAALWIDGQKTDGVDSILREIRGLVPVGEVHSKAHGKIFRITPPGSAWVPGAWHARLVEAAPGFLTGPGVFSADAVDAGSALLASHLPERMPTRVVDLGAGWGWLSAHILQRPGVEQLHLVEADHTALELARRNLSDPRLRFHWADARDFALPEPVNGVVMNPPFHEGRQADPKLGAAFIATAARLLTGAGRLWMVANRHLPYEAVLAGHFAQVSEIGGDSRFKVIEATGAGKVRSAAPKTSASARRARR